MKIKTWHKHLVAVLTIMLGGFILFNSAFLLAAVVINASMHILGRLQDAAPHFISKIIYLILIFIISLNVFKSKQGTLVKATFLTMPLMVVLVMVGFVLY